MNRVRLATAVAASSLAVAGVTAGAAVADSTPVGPLPPGPVSTVTTERGQLLAVSLPRAKPSTGLVWRIARNYNSRVVRQTTEGEIGNTIVVVFRAAGRGRTSIVFAATRGESSSTAVKSATTRVTVK
jgi:hypothetical protein